MGDEALPAKVAFARRRDVALQKSIPSIGNGAVFRRFAAAIADGHSTGTRDAGTRGCACRSRRLAGPAPEFATPPARARRGRACRGASAKSFFGRELFQ